MIVGAANPQQPSPKRGRVSTEAGSLQRVSSASVDRAKDFLNSVRDEACKTFGTVLGPGADEAHKNHLHLDMKQRRGASFCQ